jgi:acetone carboxylase gamma subunit
MAAQECPLCGDSMRLREREIVDRIPGTAQTKTTTLREWICPGCDYFEEVEDVAG